MSVSPRKQLEGLLQHWENEAVRLKYIQPPPSNKSKFAGRGAIANIKAKKYAQRDVATWTRAQNLLAAISNLRRLVKGANNKCAETVVSALFLGHDHATVDLESFESQLVLGDLARGVEKYGRWRIGSADYQKRNVEVKEFDDKVKAQLGKMEIAGLSNRAIAALVVRRWPKAISEREQKALFERIRKRLPAILRTIP